MSRVRVYISGQITGLAESKAFQLFQQAEDKLIELGYEVINPMKLIHDHKREWIDYIFEDVKALESCEAVYFLPNWKQSHGAKIEYMFAMRLGKPCLTLEGEHIIETEVRL